jgi:hypothetical protein
MWADFPAKEVYLSQNIGYSGGQIDPPDGPAPGPDDSDGDDDPPDGPNPGPDDSDGDEEVRSLPIRVQPPLVLSPQSRLPADDAQQSLR